MGIAKHFRRDHKDYRSWRDIFIKKDAPDFILKEAEEEETQQQTTVIEEEEIPTCQQDIVQLSMQQALDVPPSATFIQTQNPTLVTTAQPPPSVIILQPMPVNEQFLVSSTPQTIYLQPAAAPSHIQLIPAIPTMGYQVIPQHPPAPPVFLQANPDPNMTSSPAIPFVFPLNPIQ